MATKLAAPPRPPFIVPILNPLVRRLIRIGVRMGPRSSPMILLTIPGRRSGLPRTTPVNTFQRNGRWYVFGTFGETMWVRNLRAARGATVTQDGRRRAVTAIELSSEDAGPVLRDALAPLIGSRFAAPIVRRFYALHAGSTAEEYVSEVRHHPVFELRDA